jgi:sugar/nucleoside kinase (ribokinase family)
MDRIVTPGETVCIPGGTSIYFSNAIAALDVKAALVTAVADGDRHALASLQTKGVAVTVHPTAQTLFFENIYGDNPDERTQKVLAIADPFTVEQVNGINASIYHLGTLLAGDIPARVIKALAARGTVSLDVQGYLRKVEEQNVLPVGWLEKEEALPFVHYLKANEEELNVLTGESEIGKGATKLLASGAREVIITLGSKGSFVFTKDGFHTIPAFIPTNVKDATGCGDTYMAGYLYKRCKGGSIQEAGEFAAAMATLKLQGSGPFSGTESEVESVVKKAKYFAKA